MYERIAQPALFEVEQVPTTDCGTAAVAWEDAYAEGRRAFGDGTSAYDPTPVAAAATPDDEAERTAAHRAVNAEVAKRYGKAANARRAAKRAEPISGFGAGAPKPQAPWVPTHPTAFRRWLWEHLSKNQRYPRTYRPQCVVAVIEIATNGGPVPPWLAKSGAHVQIVRNAAKWYAAQ